MKDTLCAKFRTPEEFIFRGIVSDLLMFPLRFVVEHDDDDGIEGRPMLGELSYSLDPLRHHYHVSESMALTHVRAGVLNFSISLAHVHPVCYGGGFAVQRHLVRSHPQAFYKRLTSALSRGDNIMEGHLTERTWARMFTQVNRVWCPEEGDGRQPVRGRCEACRFHAELDDFCPSHLRDSISGCERRMSHNHTKRQAKPHQYMQ